MRSDANTIASASPVPPGNTRPTRAGSRMYAAHQPPASNTSTSAAKAIRISAAPPGPTSSNMVVAIAAPNWTDATPTRTSAGAGTDSARRLVFVLERDVLERVNLAQVRPTRVQRGLDLCGR